MLTQARLEHPGLTPGQLACLELVRKRYSSKEIAERLGISRHTVDQRIRLALRVLDVSGRSDAVRLLIRDGAARIATADLPLPVATRARPTNTMGPLARLAWIVAIGLGALASTAMYLSGLESLSRMLR